MKKILYLLVFVSASYASFGQVKEISRDWTSIVQSLDALFLKKKVKFKLSAFVKVNADDSTGYAGLWASVRNKNGEGGSFDNMSDRPIKANEWKQYLIEGSMDEGSENIYFGAYCSKNGKFYFDAFEMYIENDKGHFQKVELGNPGFELGFTNREVPKWIEGIRPALLKG